MNKETSNELHVVDRPVTSLASFSNNARTHSKRQIRQIADSIREFGFTNPVLLGPGDTIIAGHRRVRAAKLLGMIRDADLDVVSFQCTMNAVLNICPKSEKKHAEV
ncbi:MAG: putative adenine methyltransferase [Edaphobacter sp.]|nr:putative adenine methyltransferase [Edaphobacter sp.]